MSALQCLAIGVAEDQRIALGGERDAADLPHRRQVQAVAFEIERLDHFGVQAVDEMRQRGAEARRELMRTPGAAGLGFGFEHQRLAPALAKQRGADEAVVAAANDDCIK